MHWRDAHRWLRGYSDAMAGKRLTDETIFGPAYQRGYIAATKQAA